MPISHVYLLAAPGGDRFELDPLAGAAKLTALIDSTYHPPFLGCSNRHFDLCVALARHARVTRVSRPGRGHPPREMARRLERDARLPARDSF